MDERSCEGKKCSQLCFDENDEDNANDADDDNDDDNDDDDDDNDDDEDEDDDDDDDDDDEANDSDEDKDADDEHYNEDNEPLKIGRPNRRLPLLSKSFIFLDTPSAWYIGQMRRKKNNSRSFFRKENSAGTSYFS